MPVSGATLAGSVAARHGLAQGCGEMGADFGPSSTRRQGYAARRSLRARLSPSLLTERAPLVLFSIAGGCMGRCARNPRV